MFPNNQQQQQNNQLPVSYQQLDQSAYISSVPNQIPFQPQSQLSQNMQQFAVPVAGWLIKAVQDQATKNPLRVVAFNLLSQNRWANQNFEMAYIAVAEYAELLMVTQRRTPDQAIPEAANLIATSMAAMYWAQYPELQQMTPTTQVNDLKQILAQFQQISTQIGQFKAGQQQQQQPQQQNWGNQQQQQNWGNQQQQNWGNNPQQNQQQNWGNQQQHQQQGGWGNQQNIQGAQNWGNQQQQQQNNGGWAALTGQTAAPLGYVEPPSNAVVSKAGYAGRGALVPKLPNRPAGVAAEFGADNSAPLVQPAPQSKAAPGWDNMSAQRRGGQPQQAPTTVEEAFRSMGQPLPVETESFGRGTPRGFEAAAAVANPQVAEPKVSTGVTDDGIGYKTDATNPLRPMDYVVLDDGTEIRPAHISGWKRTWTVEEPYALIFNPDTHMKFHVRRKGADGKYIVKEVIKVISDDEKETMEYLQHEIRNRGSYRLDKSKLTAPSDWARVAAMGKEPLIKVPDITEEEVVLEIPEHVVVTPVIESVHSYAEAEVLFLGSQITAGDLGDVESVHEYYFNLMNPLVLNKSHIGVVKGLSGTKTLVALANRLDDLQTEETIDTQLFNALNLALTKQVNDTLLINLGYGDLVIDSFVDDIYDLGESLKEDGVGVLWRILNEERAADIIKPLMNVLSGEEYTQYLNKLVTNVPKEKRNAYQNVLGLYHRASVTHIPWSFTESVSFEPSAVVRNEQSQLFTALENLLARTERLVTTFKNHYVVDNQGRIAEVSRGYMAKESMIIRLVNRP